MSLKQKVGRQVDLAVSGLEKILALALIAGICLNFINVGGRYLASVSIEGSDEVEIYILIAIAFLGAAVVTWRGMHLRMDVLMETIGGRFRVIVSWIELAVTGVVAAFVAYYSFQYASKVYRLGAVSDIAGIPTWIPHSAVPVSLGLMVLFLIIRVWVGRGAAGEKSE